MGFFGGGGGGGSPAPQPQPKPAPQPEPVKKDDKEARRRKAAQSTLLSGSRGVEDKKTVKTVLGG